MLRKEDFENFENEYIWIIPSENKIFSFGLDNKGVLNLSEDEKDYQYEIKWKFNEDNQLLSVLVLETKKVLKYKFLEKENNNYLFQKENDSKEDLLFIKEKYENFIKIASSSEKEEMDFVDKIILVISYTLAFFILILIFNFAPILNMVSGLYSILFSILVLGVFYRQVKILSLLISKKHKNKFKKFFIEN